MRPSLDPHLSRPFAGQHQYHPRAPVTDGGARRLDGIGTPAGWRRWAMCDTRRHMKDVSLRELLEKTGSLIRDAKRLGGLIVTDRGAPIARIEPVEHRPAPSPFLSRTVLPAYQRLLRSGRLGRESTGTKEGMRNSTSMAT